MRNRSMRRWVGLAGAALLALTACAGGGQGKDDGGGDGTLTIAFWTGYSGPYRAAVEGVV